MVKQVTVDVVSDVICPWCYLGKHRLERAIAQVPDIAVAVRWRPFFLDPGIPAEGMDRQQYLTSKFGEARLATLHDPLIKIGQDENVPYAFDRITRTPNTMDAHRLIRWAGEQSRQGEVVAALFDAYWRDGRDIGDRAVLAQIAALAGMDAAAVTRDLNSDRDKLEIFKNVREAQSMGIQAVPTFIFGERMGISGAQSADVLADGMRRAVAN